MSFSHEIVMTSSIINIFTFCPWWSYSKLIMFVPCIQTRELEKGLNFFPTTPHIWSKIKCSLKMEESMLLWLTEFGLRVSVVQKQACRPVPFWVPLSVPCKLSVCAPRFDAKLRNRMLEGTEFYVINWKLPLKESTLLGSQQVRFWRVS